MDALSMSYVYGVYCVLYLCVWWVHSPYMHAVDDSPAMLIDGAFTTLVVYTGNDIADGQKQWQLEAK